MSRQPVRNGEEWDLFGIKMSQIKRDIVKKGSSLFPPKKAQTKKKENLRLLM